MAQERVSIATSPNTCKANTPIMSTCEPQATHTRATVKGTYMKAHEHTQKPSALLTQPLAAPLLSIHPSHCAYNAVCPWHSL